VIDPSHDAPRPEGGEGFHDAATFSFGDLETGRFGLARLAFEGNAPRHASGLVAVFADGELVARGEDRGDVAAEPAWEAASPAGLSVAVVEPLRAWRVSFGSPDDTGFELDFEALAEPVELPPRAEGALGGYEQLCRVTGAITVAGEREEVDFLGQRGRESGRLADGRVSLRRSLGVWLGDGEGVVARTERPAGVDEHDTESVEVFLVEGDPPAVVPVADPRLSTQYDAEGRHRRAGLELWVGEDDDYARRVAGEVVCATSFDLGAWRLDASFLRWHMQGREGPGRYDILRPA
jgi:hypothetical protein